MTKVHVAQKINQKELFAILASPSGGVAKDLFRRGKNVEAAAKKNLQRSPRRINTGHLRSSIHTTLVSLGGKMMVTVGTNVYYAVYVHEGTGIYGPKGRMIVPIHAKALTWKTKGGKRVFAMKSRGMKPNPFLKDAVKAAKG